MKTIVKQVARRFGYDILHLPTDPLVRQRMDLLRQHQINLVLDVGANTGQFGQQLRDLGYRGEIVSFEPMASAYARLQQRAAADPLWTAVHTGLGHYEGTAEINVATNSYSSSIRNMLPLHLESAPDATYVGRETIRIQRLDNLLGQFDGPGKQLYLKIDTQGFERPVLEGAEWAMSRIRGIQLELSLHPLYENETLMPEMVGWLRELGFKLKLLESGHRNYQNGELLQVEGYFFR